MVQQENTTKHLFIGGHNDGKHLSVPHGVNRSTICIPYIEKTQDVNAPFGGVVVNEYYHAHRFRCREHEWSVYVIDGMAVETAFEQLLAYYKKGVQQ